MAREIKFRAINKDGKFIYGLPYTDSMNETAYYGDYNNRMCWRDEKGAHCNQPYKNGTLMQYTGLKDKNGVEIYFGDILGTSNDNPEYDIWDLKEHGYTVVKENQYALGAWFSRRHLSISDDNSVYFMNFVEVIGNIYEHPHLLEESNG